MGPSYSHAARSKYQKCGMERRLRARDAGATWEVPRTMQTQLQPGSVRGAQRATDAQPVVLRPMRSDDAEPCGQIGYMAHGAVAAAHNVPSEQPTVEYAVGLIRQLLAQPLSRGIVAERDRTIAGSIFLNTFGSVGVIGPLTVHPGLEGGVGRRLIEAALGAARAAGLERVRLVQSPAHLRSLALYVKMGFDVQEPLVLLWGGLP